MGSVQIIYKVPLCPKIDVLVGAEGKRGVCRSKLQEHDGWFLPTCYLKRQGTSGNNYMCTEVNSQEAKPFRAMLLFLTDKGHQQFTFHVTIVIASSLDNQGPQKKTNKQTVIELNVGFLYLK